MALLHTALAHQVSLAELWELSRIAVWGGGLVAARSALRAIQAGKMLTTPVAAPATLPWSEQITWDDDEAHPALTPEAPARTPQVSVVGSNQIAWEEDEAPPTPAALARDDLVADFDLALSQMSLL